ncbi:MAG: DUF5115 domain-containing protein [Muribaculaceae bacterium]|nr:DUF5115 domain-containing protein [Muribaculaceae bacterium]
MKKYNLFLLGALGLVFAACDETDIPESIPQHNPQEDVLTIDDIIVVEAGPLATAAVFNLNDYANDPDALVQVLTLDEAINLPAGADLSIQLVLSSSQDFGSTYMLYPEYGNTEETAKNLYVKAGDWNDAHLYLLGRNPAVKTIFYRMPAYVNVNGSNYRLGDSNYYVAAGSLEEQCIDQGLVIEDNYYFLSNATTWDLNANSLKYEMYHNPDASKYDDPIFTYVWYQSGDNWWKVAPESAVELGTAEAENAWDGVLGTVVDGDEAPSGILTDKDAKAGKVAGEGKYEIKVNIEDMTYDIYDLSDGIYLVGAPEGWDVEKSDILLEETEPGSNIYKGETYVGADQFIFRFYHVLGSWDIGSIGSNNDGSTLDISLADGSYSGPVFQEGVNASSAQGNWQIPGWEGGEIEITVDLNEFTITIAEAEEEYEHVDIYLRGGWDENWAALSSYQFITTDQENVWVCKNVSISKGTEFKVADTNWGTINYGAGADANVVPGTPYEMVYNGGNLKMSVDFKGDAILTLTGESTYTLLLTPAE